MFRADSPARSISILVTICISLVALVGCGGGSGGSPVATTPSLPDTPLISLMAADLADSGDAVEKPFAQGALALEIPTAAKTERYGVLLANNGAIPSTVKVNGGGGSSIESVRSSVAAVAPAARPFCGTPALREARKNRPASSVRANRVSVMRAATTDEKLNDIVSFSVFSGGVSSLYSATYTKRNGVLRRIGTYCKLFVDPESSSNGLSAVSGTYAITEAQLDSMVASFDQHIYPLMTQNYGPSYDMDGDGRIAVFLSPLVTQNGFAGFFDTENFSTSDDSNRRDMFCMWTPSSSYVQEQWLPATCETIAHEFQHLVNFSARLKSANYNIDSVVEEDVWLDEALSMGAEIRYRQAVGDPATEERFRYYMSSLSTTSLTGFSNTLPNYGCVGLFAHYLLEQGGADRIRKLVTSGLQGKTNVVAAFGDHAVSELRTFEGIQKNWTRAVFAEMNRQSLDMSAIPAHQKYSVDLDLDRSSTGLAYGSSAQDYITGGAISMFVLEPPAGYAAAAATMYLQAVSGTSQQTDASIDCTIFRLNDAR